jgi:hypothetical protein
MHTQLLHSTHILRSCALPEGRKISHSHCTVNCSTQEPSFLSALPHVQTHSLLCSFVQTIHTSASPLTAVHFVFCHACTFCISSCICNLCSVMHVRFVFRHECAFYVSSCVCVFCFVMRMRFVFSHACAFKFRHICSPVGLISS